MRVGLVGLSWLLQRIFLFASAVCSCTPPAWHSGWHLWSWPWMEFSWWGTHTQKKREESAVDCIFSPVSPGTGCTQSKATLAFCSLWAAMLVPSSVPSCRVEEKGPTACDFRVLHHFYSSLHLPHCYNRLFIKTSLISQLDDAICFLLGSWLIQR